MKNESVLLHFLVVNFEHKQLMKLRALWRDSQSIHRTKMIHV